MKCWLPVLTALGMMTGCASKQPAQSAPAKVPGAGAMAEQKPEAESKLIVTPENLLVGMVTTYNTSGRFVVLDFPVGRMPALDQVMFVYRQGLKIGEVRITGPERDYNTVADLISGEARKGDEVRDK